MKKITFLLLAVFFLSAWVGLGVNYSQAEEINFSSYTAEVTADSVNVRSGPGENFEILRKMNSGEPVLIVDKKLDWFKIELPRNAKAFIHSEFVTTKSLIFGLINAENVNVRAGRGTNFNIIGQLNKDDQVEILERSQDWYHVFPYKNCFAWINEKYVKKQGPAKIYTDTENRYREGWKLLYEAENFEMANKQAAVKDNDISAILQKYNVIVRDYPQSMASIRAQRHIADLKRIKFVLKKKETPAPIKQNAEKKPVTLSMPTDKPIAQGRIMESGRFFKRPGTHKLVQGNKTEFFLKSDILDINEYIYHESQVWGKIISSEKSKIPLIDVTFIKKLN